MYRLAGLQLKKISVNAFFQLAVRLTSSFSTLIVTLLIAYFAGYELLGSFTKIVAFVSIFYLLTDFGINATFLKQHLKDTEKSMGNLIILRILMAIILIPAATMAASLLPYNSTSGSGFSALEKNGILIFSLTIMTTAITTSLQALLQKKLSFSLSLLPSLLASLSLLIVVYFGVFSNNLSLILFSYVVSGGVLCLLLGLTVKGQYNLQLKTQKFFSFARQLLLLSSPLGLILFFNLVYSKADTFLIALYKTNFDVGVYGISYRFFELAIAVPTFLSNGIYPVLLSKLKSKKDYESALNKYLQLFAGVSVIATGLLFIFSPFMEILKQDFKASVAPLQILSLSLPFFFLTSILQWHFLILKKLKFLVVIYLLVLVFNIFLNVIFIPKYSYMAAAATTVISEGLVFLVMLWYFKVSKKTTN